LPRIILLGKASLREYELEVTADDLALTVLEFLQKHQFPIASSCSGEGICRKCIINQNILSCMEKVSEWLKRNKKIEVSYL
jgi:ferredoxin